MLGRNRKDHEQKNSDDIVNNGEDIYATVITGSGVAVSEVVAFPIERTELDPKVKFYKLTREMRCMRDRHYADGEMENFNHIIVSQSKANKEAQTPDQTIVLPANSNCELLSMLPLYSEEEIVDHDLAVSRWIDELVW